jgi:hypothetical protein
VKHGREIKIDIASTVYDYILCYENGQLKLSSYSAVEVRTRTGHGEGQHLNVFELHDH